MRVRPKRPFRNWCQARLRRETGIVVRTVGMITTGRTRAIETKPVGNDDIRRAPFQGDLDGFRGGELDRVDGEVGLHATKRLLR
jgi:hypothetical protein